MSNALENDAITTKIQELCQTLLADPWFQSIQNRVGAFFRSEESQARYQELSEKGELLQQKQAHGGSISPAEIAEFERLRERFFDDAVARDYVSAQEEMHRMKSTVERHVDLTFELGRLPRPEELEGGSCGSGCGCGH
ncbi:MAG TPA: YlbF family regulator [Planctomycetota bacterium]|jgi:cell fate (sporulation/competence/biofilm development) regulator YlbF (YheA/YmcA/DUF963 family)|nr:YlbF family regulator [Planctomycetota bacterium]